MATPMERLMEQVDWVPNGGHQSPGDALPFATHYGVLDLLGHKLRCYRLSDGRTILHADDVQAFFGGALLLEAPPNEKQEG